MEEGTIFDTAKDIAEAGAVVVIAGGSFYIVLMAIQFLGGLF